MSASPTTADTAVSSSPESTTTQQTATDKAERSPYIVGRAYDWLFFLGPPLGSLALAAVVAATGVGQDRFWLHGRRQTWLDLSIAALIHAHLVAVLFRSHGNRRIFQRYRWRFVLIPVLLFGAMMASSAVMLIATVLATFWDVYHSALQTFGLARIYDRNRGNAPDVGRTLDWLLNQLLYVGPILAGASMLAHMDHLSQLDHLELWAFSAVPVAMAAHQGQLAMVIIAAGVLFIAYYLWAYVRLWRRGYRVSLHKSFLLASTALCSIVAWGFNPWGYAFIIMNLFHAVQYLALVWWTDVRQLPSRLWPGAQPGGAGPALLFLLLVGGYGVWAALIPQSQRAGWALVQVIALMHFWYDGFIWSVSRKQL